MAQLKLLIFVLVTFTAFMLATIAANAETYPLHEEGAWQAFAGDADAGSLYCAAATSNREGSIFSVSYNPTNDLFVIMVGFTDGRLGSIFQATGKTETGYSMHLRIDRERAWVLPSTMNTQTGSIAHVYSGGDLGLFLEEISDGDTLRLVAESDYRALQTWSLKGSEQALRVMVDCTRKAGSF